MRIVFILFICFLNVLSVFSVNPKTLNIGLLIRHIENQKLDSGKNSFSVSKKSYFKNGYSINDSLLGSAVEGNKEEVKYLLDIGADITYINNKGYSFLICATVGGLNHLIEGNLQKLKSTINKQVTDEYYYGYSAIHFSLILENDEICELLIKNGVDFNTNSKNFSILEYLLCVGNNKLIDLALKNGCSANDFYALDLCAFDNNLVFLKKLIKHGANINQFKIGFSLLFTAINSDSFDVAKFLVANKVNLNIQNINKNYCDGMTPLMVASTKNDLKYLKLLLDKNINPNLQDVNGMTALMYACKANNINSVKLLLKLNNKKTIVDADGWSPVHFVARYGYLSTLKLLIKNGYDINVKDKFGFTPIMLAVWNNHIELTDFLININANLQNQVEKGDYKNYKAQNFLNSNEMKSLFIKKGIKNISFAPKHTKSNSLLTSNFLLQKFLKNVRKKISTPTFPEIELLISTYWHTDLPSDIHFISYENQDSSYIVKVSLPVVGRFDLEEERIREKYPLADDTEIEKRMRVKTFVFKNDEIINKNFIYKSLAELKFSPIIEPMIVLHGDTYKIRIHNSYSFIENYYELQGPEDHPLIIWANTIANKLFNQINQKHKFTSN